MKRSVKNIITCVGLVAALGVNAGAVCYANSNSSGSGTPDSSQMQGGPGGSSNGQMGTPPSMPGQSGDSNSQSMPEGSNGTDNSNSTNSTDNSSSDSSSQQNTPPSMPGSTDSSSSDSSSQSSPGGQPGDTSTQASEDSTANNLVTAAYIAIGAVDMFFAFALMLMIATGFFRRSISETFSTGEKTAIFFLGSVIVTVCLVIVNTLILGAL